MILMVLLYPRMGGPYNIHEHSRDPAQLTTERYPRPSREAILVRLP